MEQIAMVIGILGTIGALFVGVLGIIGAFCVYQERRDKENQQEQQVKDNKLEASIAAIGEKLESLWQKWLASQKDTVTHDVCSKRRESCPCSAEIERIKEDLGKPTTKRRNKKMRNIVAIVAMVTVTALAAGCGSVMDSLKGKSFNALNSVYMMEVTPYDPATGTLSPSGKLGYGSIDMHTAPMKAGQEYYVKRDTYGWCWPWMDGPAKASETIIYIGAAGKDATLRFDATDGSIVKIDASGVSTKSATLTITPTKEVSK